MTNDSTADGARSSARCSYEGIVELLEKSHSTDQGEAEAALEEIQELPLEVSVRVNCWSSPFESLEPDEYRILLSFGGPNVQVVGGLERGEPVTARLECSWYSDWLTESVDEKKLLEFSRLFLFRS